MDQNPLSESEVKIDVHLKSKIKWKQLYMATYNKPKETTNNIEPTSKEYNTYYMKNCVFENWAGFLQEENSIL
jgi:hypothetical protein